MGKKAIKSMLDDIPDTWNKVSIGELIKFSGGSQPPRSTFKFEPEEGYVRLIQTRDYRSDKNITYIEDIDIKKKCEVDDIIIGRYGPPIFQLFRGLKGAYNVALIKAIPNEKLLLKEYAWYFLNQRNLRSYLESLSQRSGGQTGIEMDKLKKYPFPLPPLKEQQKIAQILSQWDEAIETTQNLITQLQLRKKGLMQELLSGKKRLAGFSDEWETIRGDKLFASISNKKHDGEFEVLSATQDKGVIPRSETGIDIKYDKKSLGNYKKLDIGDFVISLRSFQGGIEYSKYEGLVSPAYTVLREKLPIAKKFYQEYMKTENFINRLNSIIYGIRDGKQISYKEFGSLKFEYPPLEEQEAISKIIVTADSEIKEKQEYLVVLQNQKKGLMQQLLTGQKRVKI